MLEGMEPKPKLQRYQWLLIALWVFFPIVHHPWWLALVCLTIYGLLVWLVVRARMKQEKENQN
jgi:membrane protein implicated in regulation of membrane protease activity